MSKYNGSWAERSVAVGEYKAAPTTLSDGDRGEMQVDKDGFLLVNLGKAIKGEDLTNDVMKVEQQMMYARVTADTAVKSGAGLLKSIVVTQPSSSTPTAGVFTVFDNTAESGTVIFQHYFPASAVANPVPIPLNVKFSTGCYAAFDSTLAGLAFTIAYR
jgi:hypothetical protein